jgi:hypothetical protein
VSYKDSQLLAKRSSTRSVPMDEWDSADKEYMSKQTPYNRRYRRSKVHDSKFTKKKRLPRRKQKGA